MRWLILWAVLASPAQAEMRVLEDFSNPMGWQYVSDRVMGGVSDGRAQLDRDGELDFASLRGQVSTANNGGFIQIRRGLTGLPAETTSLVLNVRGNGATYYVHLRPAAARRPWDYYQAAFETSEDWTEVELPLSAFQPSRAGRLPLLRPEDVRSIGIVAYGADFTARLDVARIALR